MIPIDSFRSLDFSIHLFVSLRSATLLGSMICLLFLGFGMMPTWSSANTMLHGNFSLAPTVELKSSVSSVMIEIHPQLK